MAEDLVTGGTGFLGSAVALRLEKEGRAVRVLARGSSDRLRLSGGSFSGSIIEGDLADLSSLEKACAGVDTVFHCAAAFREEGVPLETFVRVNVDGTDALVRAAKAKGVRRFVHVSTVGVHGAIDHPPANEDSPIKPEDHYQVSKQKGEERARALFQDLDLPGVIVRPVGIYGPGDTRFLKLFRQVARGRFPMIGKGESRYHLTYIDDLVDGMLLCRDHDAAVGQTFILGGPEHVSVAEFIGMVAETLGVSPPWIRLPVGPMKCVAFAVEKVCRAIGVEPPIYRRRLDFFLKDRAFDISRAKSVLGFAPTVGVREGVKKTARAYVEQGLLPSDIAARLLGSASGVHLETP